MAILVTGGAGFIGSHTCVELIAAGYELLVIDNLCNSRAEAVSRVEQITGQSVVFLKLDLLDKPALDACFAQHKIEAVIHFAGLKAVGESVSKPLLYYHNNIEGTLNLLAAMQRHGVSDLIFSSSATVYGDPDSVPITEEAAVRPTNPYGRTKLMIEDMLSDLTASPADNHIWRVVLLRYFNPVGAHPSGLIGEDPSDIPNNLVPYIAQVAVGKLQQLSVFGDDYATPDGTGVRDYIHVMDLSNGHVKALQWLQQQDAGSSMCEVFNLGTGTGYSVLEMINAFEQASGQPVPYKIVARREGDIATCYADPQKAQHLLQWQADKNLSEMMADTWRWQSSNPNGYDDPQE